MLRNSGVICPREYIVDFSVFEKASYEVVRRVISRIVGQDHDKIIAMCNNWMQSIALKYNYVGEPQEKIWNKVICTLIGRIKGKAKSDEIYERLYNRLDQTSHNEGNENIIETLKNLDGHKAALEIIEWSASKAITEGIWNGTLAQFGKERLKNWMREAVHKTCACLDEEDAYVKAMIDAIDTISDDIIDSAVKYVLMSNVTGGVKSQEAEERFCDYIIKPTYKEISRKLFVSYFRSVFLFGICKAADHDRSIDGLIEGSPKLSDDNKRALREIFSIGMGFYEKEILQRLEFLRPVSIAEYKAWFFPLFRKYCFQDEHAHGGSHLIDLPRVGDFGGLFDGIEDDKERRTKKVEALIKCKHTKDDGFERFIETENKVNTNNNNYNCYEKCL